MKYLVAVDGSEGSKDALAWAVSLADDTEAAITAIHVAVPIVADTGGDEPTSVAEADHRLVREGLETAERRGSRLLDEAQALASELGHDIKTELFYGDPVTGIIEFAETEGFDVIFAGHRGRTERAELLLGSVAKRLVERASVPVTVVRGFTRHPSTGPEESSVV